MLQILLVTNEICLHKGLSRRKEAGRSCLCLCCMCVIRWDRFSKGKITFVLRYFLISWLLSRLRSLSNFSSKQIFTESRNRDCVFWFPSIQLLVSALCNSMEVYASQKETLQRYALFQESCTWKMSVSPIAKRGVSKYCTNTWLHPKPGFKHYL